MLVLKIKREEKIYINGGEITIQLCDSGISWAKLGFTAPASVNIQREQLCLQGPTRCCKCGGTLPPSRRDGLHLKLSTGCGGTPHPDSGRCQAFASSSLWEQLADLIGGEERAK